ncbi:AAA family ATPase [Streptomyces sp. NPDC054796]
MSQIPAPLPALAADDAVIDPAQLIRITALHKGFLYQHLYAVGCLLRMGSGGVQRLLVERDEDIEVLLPGERLYLQVKTRNRPLQWGDVQGAVDNFAVVRTEHDNGSRPGHATLIVVTDSPPGPGLTAQLAAPDWPQDVHVLHPGAASPHAWLPPAWQSLEEAITWCAGQAEKVPFTSLAPHTLVWKLAARVVYACTGHSKQAFSPEQLSSLYEQFVTELQAFPAAPDPYLPQAEEPALLTDARIRVITGFSGAGKTAWAAHAAEHSPEPLTYFDIAAFTGEAAAGALARELAARHLEAEQRTELVHGPGLDILRGVHQRLAAAPVAIVLDNVHRLDAASLKQIIDALPTTRLVLLGQPRPDQAVLAAQLHITPESLPGWSADSVAAAFTAAGTSADPHVVQRILHLTGGLPLYVHGAVALAHSHYDADPARMCQALEDRLHDTPTAQDLILGDVLGGLDPQARTVAFLLAFAEVPLTQDELGTLAHSAEVTAPACARALRHLTALGLIQRTGRGLLSVHDAARPPATECFPTPGIEQAAALTLSRLLRASIGEGNATISRLARWALLLERTGQTGQLLDLASHDYFFEHSFTGALRPTLAAVATDDTATPSNRLDALNALALMAYNAQETDTHRQLTDDLIALTDAHPNLLLDHRAVCVLATQTMTRHATAGNVDAMNASYLAARKKVPKDSLGRRILRYTQAQCLALAERWEQADFLALSLAEHYYTHLGLTQADVVAVGIDGLRAQLDRGGAHWEDDCKRLADCLALSVRCTQQMQQGHGLAAMHAMKFYHLAGAWRATVLMGQEAADDLVELGDPPGALTLLEQTLLPLAHAYALSDLTLSLRSQRAVVLAHTGDHAAARTEIDRLRHYELSPVQAAEIDDQRALIEALAARTAAS